MQTNDAIQREVKIVDCVLLPQEKQNKLTANLYSNKTYTSCYIGTAVR